jgi:hypothetical protein
MVQNFGPETIAAIHGTPAESVFGLGVKLAALPIDGPDEEYGAAIEAVLVDINRLTGAAFAAPKPSWQQDDEGGDDE